MVEFLNFTGIKEVVVPQGERTRYGYQGIIRIKQKLPLTDSSFRFGEKTLKVYDQILLSPYLSLHIIGSQECMVTWGAKDGKQIAYGRIDLSAETLTPGLGQVKNGVWSFECGDKGKLNFDTETNSFTWLVNHNEEEYESVEAGGATA